MGKYFDSVVRRKSLGTSTGMQSPLHQRSFPRSPSRLPLQAQPTHRLHPQLEMNGSESVCLAHELGHLWLSPTTNPISSSHHQARTRYSQSVQQLARRSTRDEFSSSSPYPATLDACGLRLSRTALLVAHQLSYFCARVISSDQRFSHQHCANSSLN